MDTGTTGMIAGTDETGGAKAANRRLGSPRAANRIALLDAARRLMIAEGYGAVTSRRVAAAAGLKPQLVHYYFGSMDDLLVAMLRRGVEQIAPRMEALLESDRPLGDLWRLGMEASSAEFTAELSALAVHSEAIRTEMAAASERFRAIQVQAIERHLARRGADAGLHPAAISFVIAAVSTVLIRERALGMRTGHDEAEAAILAMLERIDGGTAP